ncbi:MAG: hypothetical protein AAGA48_30935 [Myxococcota bacterium]
MSESTGSGPQAVLEALEAARRARSDDEARHASEIVDVDQEIGKLGRAIDNLVEQRDALVDYRARLAERGEGIRQARRTDTHNALYASLEAQAEAVHERGTAMEQAQPDRLALVPPLDATLQALLAEITTHHEALGQAPESTRGELKGQLEEAQRRFTALLRERTEPEAFEGAALPIDIVYCVDAPEGTPELLVVLLPVRASIDNPQQLADGLPAWLAARVGQALFAAARSVDFGDADVRTGPALDRDLLDIEVDLATAPAGFVTAFKDDLARHLGAAPELQAAKVEVRVSEVEADIVFPPDPEPKDG